MKIQVELRLVYGEKRYYPICRLAKQFADLLRQASFTKENTRKMKLMGIQVELMSPEDDE